MLRLNKKFTYKQLMTLQKVINNETGRAEKASLTFDKVVSRDKLWQNIWYLSRLQAKAQMVAWGRNVFMKQEGEVLVRFKEEDEDAVAIKFFGDNERRIDSIAATVLKNITAAKREALKKGVVAPGPIFVDPRKYND